MHVDTGSTSGMLDQALQLQKLISEHLVNMHVETQKMLIKQENKRVSGSMKDLITPLRDADENNMLHLAGKNATKERLADVSGAALQMQIEILWFKEHKELIVEGEKWMKGTTSQCVVVATLIATIVFASAFTVSGKYQISGSITHHQLSSIRLNLVLVFSTR
ncbi:hypothetical protein E3N88_02271 [Mikania micrantha]|uniref:PGG domain-containing protein n=1 Tax=Mikania micrantha TaxID=192012 RepID=A0A5N6Q3B2_9ASTR|nr:hypothetical protein E3N88_02271 [Mikania micrantha]